MKITCVEATDHVLPMFSRTLIDYTERHFAENNLVIKNNTVVTKVEAKQVIVRTGEKVESIPYGLMVWATGNTGRPVIKELAKNLGPILQNQKRGIVVDDHLRVKGAETSMYCLGDASATQYAPTAQVYTFC